MSVKRGKEGRALANFAYIVGLAIFRIILIVIIIIIITIIVIIIIIIIIIIGILNKRNQYLGNSLFQFLIKILLCWILCN